MAERLQMLYSFSHLFANIDVNIAQACIISTATDHYKGQVVLL
jgi:hypothetical protein